MDQQKINSLVSQAAATNAEEDYDSLFANLSEYELYFNVSTQKENSEGSGFGKVAPFSTPLVDAGSGLKAILFFTSRDNANLKKPYAGIAWHRALEMLVKMPQADGLIIQNSDAAWVGIDKKTAKSLLDSFKE